MKKEKWLSDLEDGNLGERLVAEYLRCRFNWQIIEYNNDNKHDIKIKTHNRGIIKIEVKTDRWEKFNRITNNMVIETFCRGKLSGISITSADYFIYFYPEWEIAYMIEVDKLKTIMKEKPNLFRYQRGVGDDGAVNAYLCNRFEMEKYFKTFKIKKSPEWDKKEAIKK